eukprot:TRINITY_DN12289_c1_g8_i4.p1 TRINITY_DN12289_c1_g8~~TRINITY_DN12289_c1_g8_i4.p1  ORF type:complete len:965 (+),score=177.09 TRINITY_DN12289_c1_g8_i4:64-2958(+)
MAATASGPRISRSLSTSLKPIPPLTKSASFQAVEKLNLTQQLEPDGKSSPSPIDLGKVLRLLSGRHSHDLIERHLHALHKVAKRNQAGYIAEDAASLAELLSWLNEQIENGQQTYVSPTIACIRPLSRSLQLGLESSVDSGRTAVGIQNGITALIAALGSCITSSNIQLANAAAAVCDALLSGLPSRLLVDVELQGDTVAMTASLRTSLQSKKQLQAAANEPARDQAPAARLRAMVAHALIASELGDSLCNAWKVALTSRDSAAEARLHLLSSLSTLSTSHIALNQLSKAAIVADLMQQLAQPQTDLVGYEAGLMVDLLFALLTHPDTTADVKRQSCNAVFIRHMVGVLRRLLNVNSTATRQLRNDFFMMTALLADEDDVRALMVDHHLFELVLRTFIAGDLPSRHPDVVKCRWTNSNEDFDLFKTSLTIVCKFASLDSAVPVLAGSRVLDVIKIYTVFEAESLPRGWTMPQYEELQLLCLSALNALLPSCLQAYHANRLNSQLLALLTWSLQNQSGYTGPEARLFAGAANSFHATGDFSHGRSLAHDVDIPHNNGHRSQARLVLRVLLTLMELRTPEAAELHQDLLDQNVLTQLVGFLDDLLPAKADALYIELRTKALQLCSALCQHRSHVQELFGTSGVEMLLPYLKLEASVLDAGLGHRALLIAAVDASWSCIAGCRLTEAHFFLQEGMFVLLDLLERCPVEFRNMVLGCVADLAEASTGLQHVLQWQGQGEPRPNIASLLCGLWRDTCLDLECPALIKGALLATVLEPVDDDDIAVSFPLCSKSQIEAEVAPLSGTAPNLAVLEVLRNERAKIYGLCSMMGFDKCYDMLGTTDRITLVLIEQYLNLKAGEVWQEVQDELDAEGIVPVDFDEELLLMAREVNEAQVQAVAQEQRSLLNAQVLTYKPTQSQVYHASPFGCNRMSHQEPRKNWSSLRSVLQLQIEMRSLSSLLFITLSRSKKA